MDLVFLPMEDGAVASLTVLKPLKNGEWLTKIKVSTLQISYRVNSGSPSGLNACLRSLDCLSLLEHYCIKVTNSGENYLGFLFNYTLGILITALVYPPHSDIVPVRNTVTE